MITVSIASVVGEQVKTTKFIQKVSTAHVENKLKGYGGRWEKFSIPAHERLRIASQRSKIPNSIITAVIKHQRPRKTEHLTLKRGQIIHDEEIEQITDLTRIWLGYGQYVLFWFRGEFPGRGYPKHRLLIAKCLGLTGGVENQDLVKPDRYNLACLQEKFHNEIWDQNFVRGEPIQTGRIRGPKMEMDPLYEPEFSNIKSYIGITIPTVGSEEKVKVIADGRLQFMSWQAQQLDNPSMAKNIIKKILEVIDLLEPCREK